LRASADHEVGDQRARDRHRAPFVRLRCAPDDAAAVREDEHSDATRAGSVSERLDLVGGQILTPRLVERRQRDARSWVARQAAITDAEAEDACQHAMRLAD
jgi:hypothetical protein